MKNIAKTLMMSACLALAGCGLSDPWEDWADEGQLPADRMMPSEVKETLCSAEGWKMTYQGVDFYYSFAEDGTATCSSNMFLEPEYAAYHFNWDDHSSVFLTVEGGGHLSSLAENGIGDTFVITSYSAQQLVCHGETSEEPELTFTSVSSDDMANMEAEKNSLRNTLAGAAGWRLDYQDQVFYFRFFEDGTAWCNSLMPQPASNTTYTLGGTISSPVLTITGGGHFTYLPEEYYMDTFSVTAQASGQISLRDEVSGTEISLHAVDQAEIDGIEDEKGIIIQVIEANLMNGAVYASDGTFLAHYAIDRATGASVRFDILENRILSHLSTAISIDENANVTFDEPVTLAGHSISGMALDLEAGDGDLTGGGDLDLSPNYTSRDFYLSGDFKTYTIRQGDGRGDACDAIWNELMANVGDWNQFEISDRDNRPIVFCPANQDNSKWYTGFFGATDISSACSDQESDLLYLTALRGDMLGLGGDPVNITNIQNAFPVFLAAYSHDDGLYVIRETVNGTENIYFISPTTDSWFKAVR